MTASKDHNKKKIFTGIFLIISAFIGVVGVVYLLLDDQQKKLIAIEELVEQGDVFLSERDVAVRQAEDLQEKVGTSIHLKKIVKAAKQEYGYEERTRKEGFLYIDRTEGALLVTLGGVHGLAPGHQLSVYDDSSRIGFVTVDTPLDTVSYVRPLYKGLDEFKKDYYRVVNE